MQFNLNFLDGIFEVTTSGDATLQGFYDFAKSVLEHEEWNPGGLILLNHTDLNTGPLTVDDVEAIASICGQNREQIGKAKVASVVGHDRDYGMVRMWQILLEMHEVWYASEKLFRDRHEAVAWLKNV